MLQSKLKSERIHAKRRALERFGLELNRQDLRSIVDIIQKQQARFIERQSLRVTIWEVMYSGQLMRAVYDSKRKAVVSFLPC